jgi:hypothetical protein
MEQLSRQQLAFRSHISDIPRVVLAFAKTTKEFALQTPRVHLIDFLNKPCPAPSCRFVCYALYLDIREFLSCLFGSCSVSIFCKAAVFMSLTLCPAGIQPIIADKVFMLWRDVLGELHYKITRLEQFYVRLPIFIVLKI